MNSRSFGFGPRLRALRLQRFRSQQAFADHCQTLGLSITRHMVADWKAERADLPAQLIPFMAHALNVRVTDLFLDCEILPTLSPEGNLPADPKKHSPSQRNGPNIKAPKSLHHPRTKLVVDALGETTPFDALTLTETQTALMAMIRTLDHKQREVLLLYFYGGLKPTEIAAKLHLPASKVSARLCRACRELRRLLFGDSQWRWLGEEFQSLFPRVI
jgi:RNA polymerase sigma factor (sigma-70 family)